ncbi:MAG: non-homologous end-joining DNA ligase [Actinomycetota bacterium]|nr:non-homologous end-joining DNA ligase [Actinomycetota bacterium]
MTAAGAPYGAELTVEVGGRSLAVSSLDRPVWPPLGWTKGELIDYYVRIAPVLLPHLTGRPLILHRYPAGVGGPHFYQVRAAGAPPWLRTVAVPDGERGSYPAPVVDDIAGLAWAGNLMAVELHPGLACADTPDAPTMVVCNLDPMAPAGLLEAADAALLVRAALEDAGLASYVKTSGVRGLHVVVPLAPGQSYDAVRAFTHELAEVLAARHPERFVASAESWRRRKGRVVLDWEENVAGASLVAPYSLRGLVTPTVSTPVTWDEVAEAVYRADVRALLFSPEAVLERVERLPRLFAEVQQEGCTLPGRPARQRAWGRGKAEGKTSR